MKYFMILRTIIILLISVIVNDRMRLSGHKMKGTGVTAPDPSSHLSAQQRTAAVTAEPR